MSPEGIDRVSFSQITSIGGPEELMGELFTLGASK